MAQEHSERHAGITLDEAQRPPESWPGAGGLRSVAPAVPSWPTGPIRLPEAAPSVPQRKAARSERPGEGWPGMQPSGSAPSTSAGAQQAAAESSRGGRERPASHAGRARTMGGALVLLVACLLLAAWVVLDPASRMLQLVVLAVVLIGGAVFVAGAIRRR